MKSFFAILAIVGSVIGSGFISGKEILVFFARFGWASLPCIFIASVLFFLLFKLLLNSGEKIREKLKKSKFAFLINAFLCIFFSAAMFAGISNLLVFDIKILSFLIFFAVLLVIFIIFKKGIGSLNKINAFLVPIMIVIFIVLLSTKFTNMNFTHISFSHSSLSVFYAILYVVLNTANGSVLIANIGYNLSKKQKTQVAFLSALTLCVILLIANMVLLLNPTSFDYAMPLVAIFSSSKHIIMTCVVFIGCLTTLLTLIYTLSSSMRGLCNNEYLIFFVSVILPLCLSLFGFNFIVEYLYPLASVLGIYLLFTFLFPERKFFKHYHIRRFFKKN